MSRDLFSTQPYLRTLAMFSFLLVVAIGAPGLVVVKSRTPEQIFQTQQTGSASILERSDAYYLPESRDGLGTQHDCVGNGGQCNDTCLGSSNSNWDCPNNKECCVYVW
nr:uncharacterized protein LOC129386556 [Dermacentor andersoni]